MRKILFRGKRVDNGEWVEGYVYKIWESVYILWGMTNGVPNMIEVIPKTVGQYTDLTDKNGKKIFEGDIVFDCGRFVVSYKNGAVGYEPLCLGEVHPDDRRWKSFYRNDEDWMIDSTDFEVIGNIHDEPKDGE